MIYLVWPYPPSLPSMALGPSKTCKKLTLPPTPLVLRVCITGLILLYMSNLVKVRTRFNQSQPILAESYIACQSLLTLHWPDHVTQQGVGDQKTQNYNFCIIPAASFKLLVKSMRLNLWLCRTWFHVLDAAGSWREILTVGLRLLER